MAVSPADSRLFGPLIGDPELAAFFSDEAAIAAMIRVERALARAGARAGVVPPEAAAAIDAGLAGASVAPEALAEGTELAGVPVPALLAALRATLAPEAARWLHWGATSQDVVDTALALRLDGVTAVLAGRVERLLATLRAGALRWRALPMAGRTRSQIAAPIAFGLRCASWAAPFLELGPELAALRPRVARVQLGGAVGANAALAPHGPAVAAALAAELGLAPAPPWHGNRVALAALGAWSAAAAAAAGRIAGDLILMGRSESGEARSGARGLSSSMPQKANPVAAETVVGLARFAAVLAAAMPLAAQHGEERDGAAWTVEWLALPQLLVAAGAALRHAGDLAAAIEPDAGRMAAMLALDHGGALAEAASLRLAARMPRPEAEALVREALAAARARGEPLPRVLDALAPEPGGWEAALDPARLAEAAGGAIDAILGPG